jgi:hypothetical protein
VQPLHGTAIALVVASVLGAARYASAQLLGQVDFPVQVSADGRRFQDSQAVPFLLHGDTAWSLMVKLTQAQTADYLEDRRQRGFNAVLVNLIERGEGGPENAAGDAPFASEDDFSEPNDAYFDHADWVIDLAAQKGMFVVLTPAYLGFQCGSQGWCQQMLDQSVSAMREYGRYLGNRFAGRPNVLWVHGGDASAADYGLLEHVTAIAEGIEEFAPTHLDTGHCFRGESGIDCYDLAWLDVNTTYSGCTGTLAQALDEYARIPARPFLYIEGRYEGTSAGPLGCLIDQQAWSVLGGATGHFFGHDRIWRFAADWQDHLDTPGAHAMEHLADLFLSRAWFRLVPDAGGDVLISGASTDAIAAQTSDGESILVYAPSARTVGVRLTGLASDSARAWWFDPATGNVSSIGVVPATGDRSFAFPGRRVLVIDDEQADLSAPASEPYELPEPAARDALLILGMLGAAWRARSKRA